MKEERKQIKKETIKTAKENSEMIDFIKSLTTEEMQRIKEVREFNEIKPGTNTYKIAIMCDSLRQQMRIKKAEIQKRLWTIDSVTNNVERLKIQLMTGITEMVKDGLVMNKSEVESLIKHNEWLRDGEFNAMYHLLASIRSLVEHKDVSGRIIMTMPQYDKYVEEVNIYLKKYGYDLFMEFKG